MKTNNLTIYQKYMEVIYYTNDILQKYPKKEQFALVTEIKQCLYKGLRLIMYGLKCYSVQEKVKYLKEFDIQLDLMKVYIRLSYKYRYITTQNYSTWSNMITDICNMLGGWIKSCQKR